MEIDQRWLIELGADRQGFVDQSQSLNLFFRPNTNIKYLHAGITICMEERTPRLFITAGQKNWVRRIRCPDELNVKQSKKLISKV